MASDLKSDLVMMVFQSRPTVHLMGNPAVELETSTLATSATTCLMEMARTSLGIRTADAVFTTQQHGSLVDGLGQKPEPKLHFVE